MSGSGWRWRVLLASALCGALLASSASAADVSFDRVVIDQHMAGDCKMAGDLDGDGQVDLVLGGMRGSEGLVWYRYPNWSRTVIADAGKEFTTDGALGDVDGDGDLDIIIPDGDSGDNLLWFSNPRPAGNPAVGSRWKRTVIGSIGNWGKEVKPGDFDRDGRLDVAVQTHGAAMVFFQDAGGAWRKSVLRAVTLGGEGMGSGDIDGDGDVDLVLRGTWVENPGGVNARNPGAWKEHAIGPAHSDFKAVVADIDRNGRQDVVFSSSEGTADVQWWTPEGPDPRGRWVGRTIAPATERCHTLATADMDGDGHLDVIAGQMHTSAAGEILVYYNTTGKGTTWRKQVVDKGGIHNGVVADIGGDGDMDIFAVNWTGNPPARLYVNRMNGRSKPTTRPRASSPGE